MILFHLSSFNPLYDKQGQKSSQCLTKEVIAIIISSSSSSSNLIVFILFYDIFFKLLKETFEF